ncbi:MAG TPA: hypothetical protein VGP62_15400 [Bryobacteraceae bacterium]|jgi:hypothetical protein|nr:hypothetical protein [Bryobacteraceae bacterium]
MIAAQRLTRWVLTATLVAAAMALAVRTLAGPIYFRSPLNVEGVIGLAVALLLLLQAKIVHTSPEPTRRNPAGDAIAVLLIAGLIMATFWRSASFYFLSDDFILVNQAKSFLYNFRSIFATPGADGSYRPITHLYMSLAYKWAGVDSMHWHWTELAIHAANSILVFVVARMLGFLRFGAAFAATLFAVHGTRPEAVVWIAGRADLLAALFVLLGLASFIRFWNGEGRAVWLGASLMSMTLGILSKESAYTFALLLVVFLASKNALRTRRALYALTPFFVVTASLAAWRIILLGGVGGYKTQTGHSEALSIGMLPVVKALTLRLASISFFPVNWSHEPSTVFGIIMVLYLAALVWLTRAQVGWNAFIVPLGFLLVLVLPPLSQLLIGADLQKARVLYLPLLGFCLMLATAVEALRRKSRWLVAITILIFNIAALFHNLNAWEEAGEKARTACSVAAACPNKVVVSGLPGSLNGVYFFANGFQECVEMQRNSNASRPSDSSQHACILQWDNRTEELSSVPYDNH